MRPQDATASDAEIIALCWMNAAIAASITTLATRRRFGHRLDRIRVYYAIFAMQTRRGPNCTSGRAVNSKVARQLTLETTPTEAFPLYLTIIRKRHRISPPVRPCKHCADWRRRLCRRLHGARCGRRLPL